MENLCLNKSDIVFTPPSLLRLASCLLYEVLTILAILFVGAVVFVVLFGDATHGLKRFLLQMFLWGMLGAYYVRCWTTSGQSLAMQAWKIRLVDQYNQRLDLIHACKRYVMASLSLVLFGLGFAWAILDKRHAFLHDRLLQSKIIAMTVSAK